MFSFARELQTCGFSVVAGTLLWVTSLQYPLIRILRQCMHHTLRPRHILVRFTHCVAREGVEFF